MFPPFSLVTTVRQIASCAVGFTQASRVMPLVKSSDALSAIVTQSLTPSNDRALPVLPAVVQVGPESVPLLAEPELSASEVPEPASNE